MTGKKNKKVVKYRKPLQFNIGIAIFAVIFCYLLYYVFDFFTTKQISAYEVTQGSIAQDNVFEGLILRDETVYYAADNGYVNYYYKDGTKANAGSYVYSVDETGEFYSQMTASDTDGLQLTDEGYGQLEAVAEQFLASYSDMRFQQVYQFKYDMEAALVEALNANARSEIGNAVAGAEAAGLHAYTAEAAGVVVYHTDGLEGVTVDTFTADMFNQENYPKENFLSRETVTAGEPVYKMINSEIWQVVIPIDQKLASDLAEETNVQVEFQKDNYKTYGRNQCERSSGTKNIMILIARPVQHFPDHGSDYRISGEKQSHQCGIELCED